MDEQMVPIVLGEAQKAVDIFEQTVDTLKKVDTIDALDKRFAAELGPQDPLGQVERVVNLVYLTPENVLLSRCVEKKFFPLP